MMRTRRSDGKIGHRVSATEDNTLTFNSGWVKPHTQKRFFVRHLIVAETVRGWRLGLEPKGG